MLVAIVSENRKTEMLAAIWLYEVTKKSVLYKGGYDLGQYRDVAYRKKDYSRPVNYLRGHGVEVVFYISDLPEFVKKEFKKAGISYLNKNLEEILQEKFIKTWDSEDIILSSSKDKDLEMMLKSELKNTDQLFLKFA